MKRLQHGSDSLSPENRSRLMARVRSTNTQPELRVRSALHRLGLRFTVAGPRNRSLPGRPDIVLPRWGTVVFVHGCFWHRHSKCRRTTTPNHRRAFWLAKFRANIARDQRCLRLLRKRGWMVVVIWECETQDIAKLSSRLARIFAPRQRSIPKSNTTPR